MLTTVTIGIGLFLSNIMTQNTVREHYRLQPTNVELILRG